MSFNNEHQILWHSIENFEMDDIESSFSFSDRLSRENDWSMEFCLRAILEYKKFMFLVCISNEPLTPSDEVDQVWHLHLLYTQSYWNEFCDKTMNKQIHHGPTRGKEEQITFKDQYQFTLDFYETIFNLKAPQDIWPQSEKRFKSIHFTRVNKEKNWIIPKLKLRRK